MKRPSRFSLPRLATKRSQRCVGVSAVRAKNSNGERPVRHSKAPLRVAASVLNAFFRAHRYNPNEAEPWWTGSCNEGCDAQVWEVPGSVTDGTTDLRGGVHDRRRFRLR